MSDRGTYKTQVISRSPGEGNFVRNWLQSLTVLEARKTAKVHMLIRYAPHRILCFGSDVVPPMIHRVGDWQLAGSFVGSCVNSATSSEVQALGSDIARARTTDLLRQRPMFYLKGAVLNTANGFLCKPKEINIVLYFAIQKCNPAISCYLISLMTFLGFALSHMSAVVLSSFNFAAVFYPYLFYNRDMLLPAGLATLASYIVGLIVSVLAVGFELVDIPYGTKCTPVPLMPRYGVITLATTCLICTFIVVLINSKVMKYFRKSRINSHPHIHSNTSSLPVEVGSVTNVTSSSRLISSLRFFNCRLGQRNSLTYDTNDQGRKAVLKYFPCLKTEPGNYTNNSTSSPVIGLEIKQVCIDSQDAYALALEPPYASDDKTTEYCPGGLRDTSLGSGSQDIPSNTRASYTQASSENTCSNTNGVWNFPKNVPTVKALYENHELSTQGHNEKEPMNITESSVSPRKLDKLEPTRTYGSCFSESATLEIKTTTSSVDPHTIGSSLALDQPEDIPDKPEGHHHGETGPQVKPNREIATQEEAVSASKSQIMVQLMDKEPAFCSSKIHASVHPRRRNKTILVTLVLLTLWACCLNFPLTLYLLRSGSLETLEAKHEFLRSPMGSVSILLMGIQATLSPYVYLFRLISINDIKTMARDIVGLSKR
ncbi:hypothetical protein EGW08_011293 [Elysia chlorotica]|uniref:Uncharacterized protein n=1 Tax=Elysia chlorotica TaxID=188477 RepID=A0A433TH62_ELYCH|nr:hypothetical protein EGW08_011293 [Elysia chlorotica]